MDWDWAWRSDQVPNTLHVCWLFLISIFNLSIIIWIHFQTILGCVGKVSNSKWIGRKAKFVQPNLGLDWGLSLATAENNALQPIRKKNYFKILLFLMKLACNLLINQILHRSNDLFISENRIRINSSKW